MPYQFVNGIRLRYETWGVGSTPLVLIHGLGSSADDWFLQLPAFAPHYLCVAVDLRGHGLSDKPAGRYTVGLFAADVAALLHELDLAPAHILGLSLGGMVAQQLAVAQPAGRAQPGAAEHAAGPVAAAASDRAYGAALRRHSDTILARAGHAALFAERVCGPIFSPIRLPLSSRPGGGRASRPTIRLPIAARSWRWRASGRARRLKRIACPTLIIAGDADRVVPGVYRPVCARRCPTPGYVPIPGGGHACNIDHADVVNAAVLEFLSHV